MEKEKDSRLTLLVLNSLIILGLSSFLDLQIQIIPAVCQCVVLLYANFEANLAHI